MTDANSLFVIFGGSGDLTFRKLLPAFYSLYRMNGQKGITRNLRIVAVARRTYTTADYRGQAADWIRQFARLGADNDTLEAFLETVSYYRLDLDRPGDYPGLDAALDEAAADSRRYFYYAVGPQLFRPVTDGVIQSGMNTAGSRIILEKPFGEALTDAHVLNDMLNEAYGEENVFHIDHYLGKEMIRNILSVRFSNALFRGIWNRDFIDNIQINAFETVGVGTRAGYYDHSGAFRDMIQNHLFQVLSVLALEEPSQPTTEALHAAQLAVLKSLRPIDTYSARDSLVLAQYKSYREEKGVRQDSRTPTYAAVRLELDTPRWSAIPVYIRTGKKLSTRETNIVIQFRAAEADVPANILVIKIQPDEGIYLEFNIKQPGTDGQLETVHMDYCQSCNIYNYQNTPEAYERLLRAAIEGDHSLFTAWDQIEVSWAFANHLLSAYESNGGEVYTYEQGSDGPEAADRMLRRDGRKWVDPSTYSDYFTNDFLEEERQ